MAAAWFVFQLLGGLWRRWHTPVVLWAVVGGTAPLQAGECLHLGDTACDACVVALLNAPEHWRSHEGDERFEIDGCDSHCDAACFFPKAIERLLGAKDEALADSILEAIGPYRACWDDVVPTLEILLEAHDEASAQRQRAIESVVRALPRTNRGFVENVGKCEAFLASWESRSEGALETSLRVALARVGTWGDWRERLRGDTEVENDLLHDVFGAPGPLDHYLGPKDAQSLRLLSTKTLRHLRNGVYARHGRRFRDAELQNYFAAQAWYRENPEYTDALLNRMDRHNLKLIRFEESQR